MIIIECDDMVLFHRNITYDAIVLWYAGESHNSTLHLGQAYVVFILSRRLIFEIHLCLLVLFWRWSQFCLKYDCQATECCWKSKSNSGMDQKSFIPCGKGMLHQTPEAFVSYLKISQMTWHVHEVQYIYRQSPKTKNSILGAGGDTVIITSQDLATDEVIRVRCRYLSTRIS